MMSVYKKWREGSGLAGKTKETIFRHAVRMGGRHMETMVSLQVPRQLGHGTPQAASAAVHTVCLLMVNLLPNGHPQIGFQERFHYCPAWQDTECH